MIDKQIIVLLSLAFLFVVALADSHAKALVDVDTECDGKPCNYTKEVTPFSPEELSAPFCVSAGNDQVICNYLPQNATLISESEYDRIFAGSVRSIPEVPKPPIFYPSTEGSGPTPSQASQVPSASKGSVPQPSQTSQLFSVSEQSIPKPSQASRPRLTSNGTLPKHDEPPSKLEKRSRWEKDMDDVLWVWPSDTRINYRIAFEDTLQSQENAMRSAVYDGFGHWKERCGYQAERFLGNWFDIDYQTGGQETHLWFYFVNGTVCDHPAAFACAFFPKRYPEKRSTVYVNWWKFLQRKKADERSSGTQKNSIALIMAHELGHLFGLAHENVDRGPQNGWKFLWKASPYDDASIMYSKFRANVPLTKTDCRTMEYYNQKFYNIKCGFVDGELEVCKKLKRNVVKLKNVKLRKNEILGETKDGRDQLLEDVGDATCLGGDMSQYILNEPYTLASSGAGYFNLQVALTECLGVRVPSDPDHAYVLQSDGNFVSYHIKTQRAVWSTQSQGRGTKGGYSIIFQKDGNLVIYDVNGVATWSSGSFLGSSSAFRIVASYWQFIRGQTYITDVHGMGAWGSSKIFAHGYKTIQLKSRDGGKSGYCLDVVERPGGKNAVILNGCDNNNSKQLWHVNTDGTIFNTGTGKCLDTTFTQPKNEDPVQVTPCDIPIMQNWEVRADGSIRSIFANRCLDNRGQRLEAFNPIQVYDCFDVWSEKWWVGDI